MARTILSSPTKEIVMGFDQPFCIIGERLNPTNRKTFMAERPDRAAVAADPAAVAPHTVAQHGAFLVQRAGGADLME